MSVIEHLKQPNIMLEELSRILKYDGFLILETPNYFNFFHTFYRLTHRRELFPTYWWCPWDLVNLVKRNPKLRFERFTSSNFFPWKGIKFVSIGSKIYSKTPALISNLEHVFPLKFFGSLMFVSAKKTKLETSHD